MTISAHGIAGMLVYWLLAMGAGVILLHLENWVRERITVDLHPLWHVIPRRLRIGLRWDRPGAIVAVGGGCAYLIERFGSDDTPYDMALVHACDEDGEPCGPAAEWVPVTSLSPLAGRVPAEGSAR